MISLGIAEPWCTRRFRFGLRHGLVGQRHVGIGGNHLRHLAHGRGHGGVVVASSQVGNHPASIVAQLGVVQNAFKPVSHIDAVLVVAHGQQHQHALVRALLAYLPLVFKLVGVVGRIVAVHGLHGNNGNLRVGGRVVELRAKRVQLRNRLRRKHMRVVA